MSIFPIIPLLSQTLSQKSQNTQNDQNILIANVAATAFLTLSSAFLIYRCFFKSHQQSMSFNSLSTPKEKSSSTAGYKIEGMEPDEDPIKQSKDNPLCSSSRISTDDDIEEMEPDEMPNYKTIKKRDEESYGDLENSASNMDGSSTSPSKDDIEKKSEENLITASKDNSLRNSTMISNDNNEKNVPDEDSSESEIPKPVRRVNACHDLNEIFDLNEVLPSSSIRDDESEKKNPKSSSDLPSASKASSFQTSTMISEDKTEENSSQESGSMIKTISLDEFSIISKTVFSDEFVQRNPNENPKENIEFKDDFLKSSLAYHSDDEIRKTRKTNIRIKTNYVDLK